MKISRNDPFDLNICVRGLGNLVTALHSDVYEYAYCLTFKRTMKLYAKEFNDPWAVYVDNADFFLTTGDPYVINCYHAILKLVLYKNELMLRFGIDEQADFRNEIIGLEATRYKPYYLRSKRSKSYKRVTLYYERFLVETIKCLYTYACVFTVQSYKVPLVLKKQANLPDEQCFRLLNPDDNNVELLKGLILDLKKSLVDLRTIRENQLLRTISRRRKKVA